MYALSRALPSEEKFGWVNPINRCAGSISANITEGSSRESKTDHGRFLQIALGSCFGLETFFPGGKQLKLVGPEEVDKLLKLIDEEPKMRMSFQKRINL